MGGIGCLGSSSTCFSSRPSSTAPVFSLLLCPSTGHPQVAVPHQYLLPCVHPPPCPHNVPFCMSPLPLSQTYLHRGATHPPPLFGTQQALHGARIHQLPHVKFHLGQKAGSQPTPPAQGEADRRGVGSQWSRPARARPRGEAGVSVWPESTWHSKANGQTWRTATGFKHVPLLRKWKSQDIV